MNETISNNAIIYAILALNSEVDLQHEYLESDDVPDDERDNEQGILDDLNGKKSAGLAGATRHRLSVS
jgi:hypothetical protein